MPLAQIPATAGADNASRTHRPRKHIRSFRDAPYRSPTQGDVGVVGRASRSAWAGSARPAARRHQGHRTAWPTRRSGAALRASEAISAAELPGAGVPFGDSASFRAFARLPWSCSPQKSVLQKTISAIRPETWEQINRALLSSARQEKLEDGTVIRLDSTVTASAIHEPSDSSLLWDAMRIMVRLLKQANALVGGAN